MEVMFKGLEWESKKHNPNSSGQWESSCPMPLLKARLDRKTGSKTHHLEELTTPIQLGWGCPELGAARLG